ncbi:MAG: protein translocase subunit SecF, partial [Oscillospiraceae bacterium]
LPFNMEVDQSFIAALLTIIGYSINDTVVIYDRIRENRALYGNKLTFVELVDKSISQSLHRSISTTVSTIIALGCVCVVSVIFNLDAIFTFAFPLILGMISGVYSTICIAGPLWALWETKFAVKLKKNKTKKTA